MDVSKGSAIITGGGSGLGEACARRLAGLGAKCVIVDLNEEKGKAVAEELAGAFVKADVSNAEQVQEAVDTAAGFAPLRVLVNGESNAALAPDAKSISIKSKPTRSSSGTTANNRLRAAFSSATLTS